MRKTSTVHIHRGAFFGKKTLGMCCKNEDGENFTLIDLNEHPDNLIVIDAPDYFPKKRKVSGMHQEDKKHSFKNVICLDDDDVVVVESPSKCHSGLYAKSGSCTAEASTNRSYIPSTWNFEDIDVEVDEFGQKIVTPVKLSKCKRTYSGKASARKSYGLNTDSKSDSSASSDYPDCVLVEDVSGNIREEWEKAFQRKKSRDIGQSGTRYKSCCSPTWGDCYHRTAKRTNDDRNTKLPPLNPCTKKFSNEEACTKENADYNSVYASVGGPKFQGKPASAHPGHVGHRHFQSDRSSSFGDDKWKHSASSSSRGQNTTKETGQTAFRNAGDGSLLASKNSTKKGYCQLDSHTVDGISLAGDLQFRKAKRQHDESMSNCDSGNEDDPWHPVNGNSKTSVDNCTINEQEMIKDTDGRKRAMEDFMKNGYRQTNCHNVAEVILCSDIHIHKAKIQQDEDLSNSKNGKDDDQRHPGNGNSKAILENCLINEREIIKETDQYKRAMEEEWASRQQVLQIQAEEAQHLRRLQKRKRAESMRILDMEKRQKQRVEEIRNTQKKDEENMCLKEVIRAEVSQELQKLEVTCHSMASLLHSLGIDINGWPSPLQLEVHAAYKRALLTFHPDRALHYDLRQQVEAEEKFKLITRFKEKFLLGET